MRVFVAKYAQGQTLIVLEASPVSAMEVLKKIHARLAEVSPSKVGD